MFGLPGTAIPDDAGPGDTEMMLKRTAKRLLGVVALLLVAGSLSGCYYGPGWGGYGYGHGGYGHGGPGWAGPHGGYGGGYGGGRGGWR